MGILPDLAALPVQDASTGTACEQSQTPCPLGASLHGAIADIVSWIDAPQAWAGWDEVRRGLRRGVSDVVIARNAASLKGVRQPCTQAHNQAAGRRGAPQMWTTDHIAKNSNAWCWLQAQALRRRLTG